MIYDPATNQWLVSRFADVNALLRDRRLGRSYVHVATHEEFGPDAAAGLAGTVRRRPAALQLIDMEPPDHTRLRRLVSHGVHATNGRGPPARGSRRSWTGSWTRRAGAGEFDLLADVIEQLPVAVIAELLGIPAADRPLLRPWSADMTLMFELDRDRGRRAPGRPGDRGVLRLPAGAGPRAARAGPGATS